MSTVILREAKDLNRNSTGILIHVTGPKTYC
jgi:hypothetical protein